MERQQLEYSKRVSGLIFFVCLLSTWSILKEFTHYLHKYYLVTKSRTYFLLPVILCISIFTVCILTSISWRHFLQRAILIPEQRIIVNLPQEREKQLLELQTKMDEVSFIYSSDGKVSCRMFLFLDCFSLGGKKIMRR